MQPEIIIIIIGLEIHVQLDTKTKLFCSCPTKAEEPNTSICVTCLGHPGSKPLLNKKALEYGAKLALALGCKLAPTVTFSRKTYFYPDLVKNFQITQYELPLGSDGQIVLENGKLVKIQRIHIEEDPGALIHEGGGVLIDYNRSGIPLCEIVTAPDMNDPAEAREFLKKLINVLGYLGIFDQNNCIIKADANVSIKEKNFTRVEIKNITGFKEIERALNYEIARQKEQKVTAETRGWNAEKGITYSMRSKESEEDYGYIVEPDLPVFEISPEWARKVQESIPELGEQRAVRWQTELRIDPTDAKIIAANIEVADLFERLTKKVDPVFTARWVRREVLRVLNDQKKTLKETSFTEEHLTELFKMLFQQAITDRIGQRIIERLATESFSPKKYVEEQNLLMVEDEGEIENLCKEAIKNNPKAVEDYAKGEQKSLQFLIGQVMRASKGKAKPQLTKELLQSLLK